MTSSMTAIVRPASDASHTNAPPVILECLHQAVDRERIRERGNGSRECRRLRQTAAAHLPVERGQRAYRARGAEPRELFCARRAHERRAGGGSAEFAALGQGAPGGIECATADVVKCAGEKI